VIFHQQSRLASLHGDGEMGPPEREPDVGESGLQKKRYFPPRGSIPEKSGDPILSDVGALDPELPHGTGSKLHEYPLVVGVRKTHAGHGLAPDAGDRPQEGAQRLGVGEEGDALEALDRGVSERGRACHGESAIV
jgi:hypothetical protein